jgi:uncharacterized protein YbcI
VTISPEHPRQSPRLGDEALERIAISLSDLYYLLYEERPRDPHASLTGNMLAFVFEGGLTVADDWLLRSGREERLRDFRQSFFGVVEDELVGVVRDLTGVPVTYSFYGFDPKTRSTHMIFVLDLAQMRDAEERQAVLNWSEQVRRNARRLREQHQATRETSEILRAQMQGKRADVRRWQADDADGGRSEDP